MLILGLDTCCMPATAAVCDGTKLFGEFVINCGKTHSQKIMPEIENMLKSLSITPCDIDCFAVAAGPGSFTGVRIGVATIKALAHGTNKPCVVVSTLEALAQNTAYFDGLICPMLDARRNQVYTAVFRGGHDGAERISPDEAIELNGLLKRLKEQDEKVLFLGDGIFVYKDEIEKELGDMAVFAQPNLNMNMAGAVAYLGALAFENGSTVPYSEVVPSYVRLSQAEREREEKLQGEKLNEAKTK